MPDIASDMLWAFAILATKHAAADFYLQTPYQYLNKGTYGHPGGLVHAGLHAVLTPFVYLVLAPATLLLAILVPLAEFVLHYHIDWAKEQATRWAGWTTRDGGYWRALGTDQLLHALTYIAIVAVLVRPL